MNEFINPIQKYFNMSCSYSVHVRSDSGQFCGVFSLGTIAKHSGNSKKHNHQFISLRNPTKYSMSISAYSAFPIITAFITLDWDWHWEHSAPAQCPACTQRPTELLWRNVGYSCPCITMWKLVPALKIQHIMPCMNSTEPLEIYMLPGHMEEEAWPDPRPLPLVSK